MNDAWAAFRLEFLGDTDARTIAFILQRLVGITVQVKSKGRDPFDAKILDLNADRWAHEPEGNQYSDGILVQPLDYATSEPEGDEQFIIYEHIEAIGVY